MPRPRPSKANGRNFLARLGQAQQAAMQARAAAAAPVTTPPPSSPPPLPSLSPIQSTMDFNLSQARRDAWLAAEPHHTPWPWQLDGVAALVERERTAGGAILCEHPGDGKSMTVLLHVLRSLQARVRAGHPRFGRPTLIVVPHRLVDQCERQAHAHFAPGTLHPLTGRSTSSQTAADAVLAAPVDRILYCIALVLVSLDTLKAVLLAQQRRDDDGPSGGGVPSGGDSGSEETELDPA